MGSNTYIATSGAVARLRQLEIVANNLANADSVGFKADRAIFASAFESAVQGEAGALTEGAPGGVFVRVAESRTSFAPGPVNRTGAPFDVAIDGPGFFAVETPEGERLTRAGNFLVGSDGTLQTREGHAVLGASGQPLEAGPRAARISAAGELVDDTGASLGRLQLVAVDDADLPRLVKAGQSLFAAPEDLETSDSDATLLEGSLEGANVKPTVELAVMLMLQRAFEASMHAVQAEDRATERLIQEVSQ